MSARGLPLGGLGGQEFQRVDVWTGQVGVGVVERVERVGRSDSELELDAGADLDKAQREYVVDLPPEQRHFDSAGRAAGQLTETSLDRLPARS